MPGPVVFLCHNSTDKASVEQIAGWLLKQDIRPWLDSWNLIPGEVFQPKIEEALRKSDAIAVFIGPADRSPYQNEELYYAIDRRGRLGAPVIPVLLPGAPPGVEEGFLGNRTFVRFGSLEDTDALRLLVCGIKGIAPGPDVQARPAVDGSSPYPGLAAFDVNDWPLFFGRDRVVSQTIEKLDKSISAAARIVSIVGTSGSGKSSVARAGVIHKWIEKHPERQFVVFTPGRDPLSALNGLQSKLAAIPAKGQLLVVVDQFEELYTLCEDRAARAKFLSQLSALVSAPDPTAIALLTLRADFFGNSISAAELAQSLSEPVLLGPMRADELASSIREPAISRGCTVEDGLVNSLVRDCEAQPSPLPLLQIVLNKLWEAKGGARVLTLDSYQRLSLDGAIDRHAEDFFEELQAQQKDRCLWLFLQLAEPLEDGRYVRKPMPLEGLLPAGGNVADVKQTEELIGRLAGPKARLISIQRERDQAEVEVAHEAILRGWKRLGAWLAKNSEFLFWKKRLDLAVADWRASGKRDYLLSGASLAHAKAWLKQKPAEHGAEETEFVRVSAKRAWLRRSQQVAGFTAVLLLAAGGIYFALKGSREAQALARAWELVNARRPMGIVLAYDRLRRKPDQQAQELLQAAVQGLGAPLLVAEPLASGLTRVCFSGDGTVILAAGGQTAWFWKLAASPGAAWTAERIPIPVPFSTGKTLSGVALAVDGARIALGTEDGALRLWDLPTKAEPFSVPGQGGMITALALAPDGRHAAFATESSGVVWWDLSGAKVEARFAVPDRVRYLAIRPDSGAVAAALDNGEVRILPLGGKMLSLTLAHPLPTVNYAAFAGAKAQAAVLATAVSGGSAYLWDLSALKPRSRAFREVSQSTMSAALSQDGRRLVTLNADSSLTVWNPQTGSRDAYYRPPPNTLSQIAMSGNGAEVAAAVAGEGKVRIYELDPAGLRERAWDVIVDQRPNLGDCQDYLTQAACKTYLEAPNPP